MKTGPLFNFNPGNFSMTKAQLKKVESLIYADDNNIIQEYHNRFINEIGTGYGISLSSGRMALYILLNVLNIGKGDEVIVVGFTCSVMINAILRVGATPVFSDVNEVTFGTDPVNVKVKITNNTKMIVAQHSFGIPCDIEEIIKIGKENNIFVLEDSALAFGSIVNGIKVGNFGDAALFSTDHTKPINTLVGGFLFTKNQDLFEKIASVVRQSPDLTLNHRRNIFQQFLNEKKWFSPEKYRYGKYYNLPQRVIKKITGKKKIIFMDGDYGPPNLTKPQYPYPSKLPTFLAQLGIYELNNFEKEKKRRTRILRRYLEIFRSTIYYKDISLIYFKENINIVPLRFVFFSTNTDDLINQLSGFIDFSQVWFRKPIIATNFELKYFKYQQGSCPNSEYIGKKIINFPCVIPEKFEDYFFKTLERKLNKTI